MLQLQLYKTLDAVGAHEEPSGHGGGEGEEAEQERRAAKESPEGEHHNERRQGLHRGPRAHPAAP